MDPITIYFNFWRRIGYKVAEKLYKGNMEAE
jgi:hypothetical protein